MSKQEGVVDFSTAGHQSITELSSSEDDHCKIEQQGKKPVGATPGESKLQQQRSLCFAHNNISLFRSSCGKFVDSNAVQWLVVLMIIANAIMMGVATFDFVEKSADISKAFETADLVFLVLFSIELLLQFIAHGVIGVLSNGWMCFDTIIIVASWSLAHLQVARAVRIIRAIRLATRLEALRGILLALVKVSPSVTAIMALLLLGTYWFTG
jgi:Ion transport protein